MTRIDVGRGLLVVGFLCCAGCKTSQAPVPRAAARTFTFTVEFKADLADPAKRCPASARPDVANCDESPKAKSADPDCVYVSKSRNDKVKFKPAAPSADPRFTISFADCTLSTAADPSQPDGKHWDLVVHDAAPDKVCKFSVVTDGCRLDPTIIVGN
jgi:hypothetical protein